jgi:hypothetical protein
VEGGMDVVAEKIIVWVVVADGWDITISSRTCVKRLASSGSTLKNKKAAATKIKKMQKTEIGKKIFLIRSAYAS